MAAKKPDRPKGNGTLVNYRLDKVEDAMIKYGQDMARAEARHEERFRKLEDFVTREGAGGVPMKTIWIIAGVVGTIFSAVLIAALKYAGLQ